MIIVPTKNKRHQIYKDMLANAIAIPETNFGFCLLLELLQKSEEYQKSVTGLKFLHANCKGRWKIDFTVSTKALPELKIYEPKSGSMRHYLHFPYWTSNDTRGWNLRIKWLMQAIEDTAPTKRN